MTTRTEQPVRPQYASPYVACVPAPTPIPWGWQAAPADTLRSILERAGVGERAERIHDGQHAASFRIISGDSGAVFVTWFHGGGFTIGSTGAALNSMLVDALVAFVNGTETTT
jgi:hypothetical protein